MATTIEVVDWGTDQQFGGDKISIEVEYDGKKASILLRPGSLLSVRNDLPDELKQLGKALQEPSTIQYLK